MKVFLQIDPKDNVLVALQDLPAGTQVEWGSSRLLLPGPVRAKHKFLIEGGRKGQEVIMYGVLVGRLNKDLPAGAELTTENLIHATADLVDWQGAPTWSPPNVERWRNKTFAGFHRPGGRVGTRNLWLVVPLVFCENQNVEILRDALIDELGYGRDAQIPHLRALARRSLGRQNTIDGVSMQKRERPFPNVDGIRFLTHDAGCGGTRQDAELFVKLVAAYIDHPNVAGATVLSLGCQNAEVDLLRKELDGQKPVHILDHQTVGDRRHYLEMAVARTIDGLTESNNHLRKSAPLNKLTLGLECGGSDGFSGISANPVLGYVSDLLVALGGSAILAEFPELAGVEQELINRSVDQYTADRFVQLMRDYGQAVERSGSSFAANPSPGNIRDGLVTDAMKSAGAAKKGGTSPVVACLDYTEPVEKPGLHLLCTPGNDVESTTALAGSGANLIVFTTGLGTPTGNPVAPVLKMSSNTALAERMPDIIDFDAGTVIRGKQTIMEAGEQLLDKLIAVASGEHTKSDMNGQEDFIVWKRGVSL
ncbi:MAG: altronate dehydratase family protein [Bacteroidota bacterium]